MSELLQSDMEALLAGDSKSQSLRRNFVRAACSLIEGYAHCFREMCQVGLATGPGSLSADEAKVLTDERAFGSTDRVKLTVRAIFRLFELPKTPDFSERGWLQAQQLFNKRHRLMHPKSVEDLAVSDEQWDTLYDGATWIFRQLFSFMSELARVPGTGEVPAA
jgi:hypothetical protein